jgi:hypothetical protein
MPDYSRPVAVIGPQPEAESIAFYNWAGFAAVRAQVEASMERAGALPQPAGERVRHALGSAAARIFGRPALSVGERAFIDLGTSRILPWDAAERAARARYATANPDYTLEMLLADHESHPLPGDWQGDDVERILAYEAKPHAYLRGAAGMVVGRTYADSTAATTHLEMALTGDNSLARGIAILLQEANLLQPNPNGTLTGQPITPWQGRAA